MISHLIFFHCGVIYQKNLIKKLCKCLKGFLYKENVNKNGSSLFRQTCTVLKFKYVKILQCHIFGVIDLMLSCMICSRFEQAQICSCFTDIPQLTSMWDSSNILDLCFSDFRFFMFFFLNALWNVKELITINLSFASVTVSMPFYSGKLYSSI